MTIRKLIARELGNPLNSSGEDVAFSVNAIIDAIAAGIEGPAGPAPTVTDNGDGTFTITGENGSILISDGTDGDSAPIPTITDNGDGTYTIDNGNGQSVTFKNGEDGETPTKGIDYFDGRDGSFVTRVYRNSATLLTGRPSGGTFNGTVENVPSETTDTQSFEVGKVTYISENRYDQNASGTWSLRGNWSTWSPHVIKGDKGDGATIADNADGTYTITGENGSITISDGADGDAAPIPTLTNNGDGTYTIDNGNGDTLIIKDGKNGDTPIKGQDYFDGLDGSFVTRVFRNSTTKLTGRPTGGTFNGTIEVTPSSTTDTPSYEVGKITHTSENRYDQNTDLTWSQRGQWSIWSEYIIQGPKGDQATVVRDGNKVMITGGNGSVDVFDGNTPDDAPIPTFTENANGSVTINPNTGAASVTIPKGDKGDNPVFGVDFFNGADGSFTSFVYKNGATKPATRPTGGTFNGSVEGIPNNTSGITDVPNYTAGQIVWRSQTKYVATLNTTTGAVTWANSGWSDWSEHLVEGEKGDKGDTVEGARGAGHYYANGTSWSDSAANNATPDANRPGDRVTISNEAASFSETQFWDGDSWEPVAEVIDGNLVVNGAAITDQIFANDIQVTQSLTIDNNATSIILDANSTLPIQIIRDDVTLFAIGDGVGIFDGSIINDGSILGRSISQNAIDLITSSFGIPLPASGGLREDDLRSGSGSLGGVISFTHGSNITNISVSVSATNSQLAGNYSNETLSATFTLQRKLSSATTWNNLDQETFTAQVRTITVEGFTKTTASFSGSLSASENLAQEDYDYRVFASAVGSSVSPHIRGVLRVQEDGSGGATSSNPANNSTIALSGAGAINISNGSFTLDQNSNKTITIEHGTETASGPTHGDGALNVVSRVVLSANGHVNTVDVTNLANSFLGINAKAADANLLDGINSLQFVRSDTGTIPAARVPTLNQNTTGNAATVTNGLYTNSQLAVDPSIIATTPDGFGKSGIRYTQAISLFGRTDGALYANAYASAWQHQIYGDYRTGQIAVRGRNSGTWQAWRTVLDSSNFNNYAPTKTGGGASGNWGIDISGRAATATWADQVDVNSGNTSTSTFPLVWHSGDTVYSTQSVTITPSAGRINATTIATGSGGFVGNANVGGTGNAAYLPNGLYANGVNSWIYGNINLGGNGSSDSITLRNNLLRGNGWTLTGAGVLNLNGNIRANDATATGSTLRLKNIQRTAPNSESLDKVYTLGKLGVAVGTLKSGDTAQVHRWAIAENVHEVMPEVVRYDDKGRPDALAYSEMIPDAYGAIAALKDENDQLRSRLAKLEALVEKLL